MWKPSLLILVSVACASAQPPGGPGGAASGDGVWSRNAAFGELETFDNCNGHQPQSGMYHHHINPICLRAQLDDNVVAVSVGRLGTQYAEKPSGWNHSPILGWAFDGYPVYGPYGYSNPKDSSSPLKRMRSSFRTRALTERHTLPEWFLPYHPGSSLNLASTEYGPNVSAKFPLGRYVADYDYVPGAGDLDQYNGRTTVTPEYPNGTYAYFVTVADDGTPAFPYIFNVQFYGVAAGGTAQTVPSTAFEYFNSGTPGRASATADPQLGLWYTQGSRQNAQAITGYDPSAGPSTTWPSVRPAGAQISGGNTAPALSDVQRIRADASLIYVNSNNLPSYVIGPWFEASMPGGVFGNFASSTNLQVKVPRAAAVAGTKASTGMGPVGVWVNGVAIFNVLDGASYSVAAGDDQGGGGVSARATHVSAASLEHGPIAPGSLVTAYPEFNATLATSTASAAGTPWPLSLGGTTVTVTDSLGVQLPAGILYVSPGQVNYQMPAGAAAGFARVTIASGATAVTGSVNVSAAYPGIFMQAPDGLAAAQILRVHLGQQTTQSLSAQPVIMGADQLYLILYGTGVGASTVSATIGDVPATVAYSGPQGAYPGLDQVNLQIPASLAGKGRASVVVTAAGKASNPVYLTIQ